MTGRVEIDPTDPTPPYEQLRRQLQDLITVGALPTGTRLSPVRRLAGDLGLAPGTVARAYRELEAAGFVRTRRGGGTTVLDKPKGSPEQHHADLAEAAARFVTTARAWGFDDAAITRAVADTLAAEP